jgi:hypothetical protein
VKGNMNERKKGRNEGRKDRKGNKTETVYLSV